MIYKFIFKLSIIKNVSNKNINLIQTILNLKKDSSWVKINLKFVNKPNYKYKI